MWFFDFEKAMAGEFAVHRAGIGTRGAEIGHFRSLNTSFAPFTPSE